MCRVKSFRMLLAFVLALSVAPSITRCDEAISDVAGRTLKEWSSELKSPTPVVRRRAVLSIGAFGKSAVPVLIQALSHDDDVVRYWAASELGDLGGDAKSAAEPLQKMLENV